MLRKDLQKNLIKFSIRKNEKIENFHVSIVNLTKISKLLEKNSNKREPPGSNNNNQTLKQMFYPTFVVYELKGDRYLYISTNVVI